MHDYTYVYLISIYSTIHKCIYVTRIYLCLAISALSTKKRILRIQNAPDEFYSMRGSHRWLHDTMGCPTHAGDTARHRGERRTRGSEPIRQQKVPPLIPFYLSGLFLFFSFCLVSLLQPGSAGHRARFLPRVQRILLLLNSI